MRFRRASLEKKLSAVRSSKWARSLTWPRGWAAMAGAVAVLVLTLAGVAVAGVFPGSSPRTGASGPHSTALATAASRGDVTGPAAPGRHQPSAGPAAPAGRQPAHAAVRSAMTGSPSAGPAKAAPPRARTAALPRRRVLRTSCRSVGHIGDSTSVGLISPEYLPDPAQRLAARYAGVGVRDLWVDASGGRSIVEVMPGQVNGYNVARAWRSEGYRGCWVFALGTNDTANVSVGSAVGRMGRIEEMMSVAHGEPVLWVNVKTLDASGPWAEANMQIWNAALREACARYPNMRIFDWASVASPAWFISDGVHYTSAGYAARAQAIADALAWAFGRGGDSRSCVVR